jgi:hypothetical protein
MVHVETLKGLFQRYRRPGDLVFACFFLTFSFFLLSQIMDQTEWRAGGKLFAQPRFWPAVSLSLMTLFAALHLISSACSERILGRWNEVGLWIRSLEFAGWFVVYAFVVPHAGYLPATVFFGVLLTLRMGYRGWGNVAAAAISAVVIVLLFKTFLQVKLPGGQVYEVLPEGFRQFMLTYF